MIERFNSVGFQFQSGAIQSVTEDIGTTTFTVRFNSKVVRFKVQRSRLWSAPSSSFQFQSGAIQSTDPFFIQNNVAKFQFQSGAIQRVNFPEVEPTICGFQFQSGAIQSFLNLLAQLVHQLCFNSKVVRFKA